MKDLVTEHSIASGYDVDMQVIKDMGLDPLNPMVWYVAGDDSAFYRDAPSNADELRAQYQSLLQAKRLG
ncbi:MAG: hypothetical protein AAF244_00280 [Pseudomonadota bacterium]